jgi:hypothetical protein
VLRPLIYLDGHKRKLIKFGVVTSRREEKMQNLGTALWRGLK